MMAETSTFSNDLFSTSGLGKDRQDSPLTSEVDVDTPRSSVFSTATIVPDKPDTTSTAPTSLPQGERPGYASEGRPRVRRLSVSALDAKPKDSLSDRSLPGGITLGQAIVSDPQTTSINAVSEVPVSPRRHHSGIDAYYPHLRKEDAPGHHTLPRSQTVSGVTGNNDTTVPTHPDFIGETSLASARRWFSHLPGMLLHPRGSITSDSPGMPIIKPQEEPEPLPVVRRRKGEVDCLEYKTIDDPGMRRLEGRS
jgi:hypothetical protein